MALLIGEDDRIAYIRYKGIIHIFCMEKWVWVLDRIKWHTMWIACGYESNLDLSDRFDIAILDEHTIDEFLAKAASFEINADVLKQKLAELLPRTNSWWDVEFLFSRLFIDFDKRHLTACYSFDDGPEWEKYIPGTWTGEFKNFLTEYDNRLLPEAYRYWVIDGVNILDNNCLSTSEE